MPERVQAAPRHLQRIENRPEPMLDHLPRDKQLSLRDWMAALDVALQHGQRLWKWGPFEHCLPSSDFALCCTMRISGPESDAVRAPSHLHSKNRFRLRQRSRLSLHGCCSRITETGRRYEESPSFKS